MQHLQWQRHEGLILQMVLPCIVASCVNHTNEPIFEMDLLQLRYFLYKSVIISNIKRWALLSVCNIRKSFRSDIIQTITTVSYVNFIEFVSCF